MAARTGWFERLEPGWRSAALRAAPQQRSRPGFRACACAARAPRNRCGINSERFHYPVLAWRGPDDDRFAAHALRLARLVPHGRRFPGPGRRPRRHLAQPEQAGRIVRQLARRCRARRRLRGCSRTRHSNSPIAKRAPARIWSRAVVPSMGSRARPSSVTESETHGEQRPPGTPTRPRGTRACSGSTRYRDPARPPRA